MRLQIKLKVTTIPKLISKGERSPHSSLENQKTWQNKMLRRIAICGWTGEMKRDFKNLLRWSLEKLYIQHRLLIVQILFYNIDTLETIPYRIFFVSCPDSERT